MKNYFENISIGDILANNDGNLVVKLLEFNTGVFEGSFKGEVLEAYGSKEEYFYKGEIFHAFRIEGFYKIE